MSNQGLRGWSRRLRAGAIGALVLSSAVLSLGSVPAFAQTCQTQRECLQETLDMRKKVQAMRVAKGDNAGARLLQPEIDKLQESIRLMDSNNPQAATPRPPAKQPAPPPGPPANKSTVTGVVKPPQKVPEPTRPTPVAPPEPETPGTKTVREILEPQKDPQQQPQPQPQQTNPQPQQQAPSPQQATGSPPPAVQKEGGVRLDVKSQGKTEDLNRNDVLKLLRKPGT